MVMVTFEIDKANVMSLIAALSQYVAPENINLYEKMPLPQQVDDDKEQELVSKIVQAIKPKPNQIMRVEALQAVLNGHDTFWDQEGESDYALRAAIAALSKALRKIFAHDKAIQRLAVPKKNWFDDGSYKGTTYTITPLGEKVRTELLEAGII